ncbi:TPA: AAA family ATPase [Elizabethkingia anophelis]|nr:AAA family ATPase [Elizabethkingia anophelis]MCT4211131.1 AAA family ATPase [Elizabethkingia anophelis]
MSQITKFCITGLFKIHNVEIPFDENIKILIGENGLGKTTILNTLYYTLTKKWTKLQNISFNEIELHFDNNNIIRFSKENLNSYLLDNKRQTKRGTHSVISQLRKVIPNIEELKETLITKKEDGNYSIEQDDILKFIVNNQINRKVSAPTSIVVDCLIRLLLDDFVIIFEDIIRIIDENITSTIIYFPTYRRVEEELQNLGPIKRMHNNPFDDPFYYDDDNDNDTLIQFDDDTLIQFGMKDVDQRITDVLKQINDMSLSGFTTVTGQILTQMLKGFPVPTEADISKLKTSDIEIILNRVRGNLTEQDRNNILGIIASKNLSEKKDLIFFLTKLIEIYEKQKELDNRIKTFVNICNKYLVNKSLNFDESSVTIEIKRNNSNEPVKLNQLSSGEKQIVSIFSKIYLEDHEDFIILFDEPELSLSIEWQKQLLPDIVSSDKCNFMISITHSPFIFKNDLDKYAVGMNIYID